MRYNEGMEKITVAVIGGGASGLILSNALAKLHIQNAKTVVFERGERVGRKLSATGNGQGNITNARVLDEPEGYFSTGKSDKRISALLSRHTPQDFEEFWSQRGVALVYDERGRAYPASRQASSLTDALRFYATEQGVELRVNTRVIALEKSGEGFLIHYEKEGSTHTCYAQTVVLCTGGKAAKNFGTDGSAYALAQKFGHTLTRLYPSLVQLKTETTYIKTLKGIRVTNGLLRARTPLKEYALCGDIIFTDYGVSGDAVFRLSAFIAHELESGKVSLSIDFLPELDEEKITQMLLQKRAAYPALDSSELLFGIVNNQIGRAIMRRAAGDMQKAAQLVKDFPLQATGSLGFDYAQVTKGGVPLSETDEHFESRFAKNLYLAGEILDVDGQCGGFNLHFAYASACAVAEAIAEKLKKGGQNAKGGRQV